MNIIDGQAVLGLETIEIFESLFVGLILLPLRLVDDPPLLGVDGLYLPDSSEDPDEPDGPDCQPDGAHGVEPLLDGDTLPLRLLALLHQDGAVAGVVTLRPGGAEGGVAELQRTGDGVWHQLLTLPVMFHCYDG